MIITVEETGPEPPIPPNVSSSVSSLTSFRIQLIGWSMGGILLIFLAALFVFGSYSKNCWRRMREGTGAREPLTDASASLGRGSEGSGGLPAETVLPDNQGEYTN